MSDQHTVARILVEHGTNSIHNTYLKGNSLFQALQTHHFQKETDFLPQKMWQKIRLLYSSILSHVDT
jgi:hypothetical protein